MKLKQELRYISERLFNKDFRGVQGYRAILLGIGYMIFLIYSLIDGLRRVKP